MAWIGAEFAAMLPRRAAQMLVAFALGVAAIELALPIRLKTPQEPTRSIGAVTIVLLARQIGDGARFAVFALAAWTAVPLTAGLGGALGGAVAVNLGWGMGAQGLNRLPLPILRRVLAAGLLVAALFIGLNARYAAL
jgi:putative Ca2+/H+ antiporter (TMEM165/GDT1 family)